jgi:hypothetical protein
MNLAGILHYNALFQQEFNFGFKKAQNLLV